VGSNPTPSVSEMSQRDRADLSRRELMAAGIAAGASLAWRPARAVGAGARTLVRRTDFAALPAGGGWGPGWRCPGVAGLRVAGGEGLLEAGSDVFPNDPRPVAFLVDGRIAEGSVAARIARPGSLAGVVLRRTAPRDYYAALFDPTEATLAIVRRTASDLVTLAWAHAFRAEGELSLELSAAGTAPTSLRASITDARGVVVEVTASDGHAPLQRAGDAGVLGQARTLLPSAGPPVLPALGNLHLLPYAVQEGQAVIATPVGQALIGEIARQSTVAFKEIVVRSRAKPGTSPASVIAATTGVPRPGGARLHVATDLPAEVEIETSRSPNLDRARRLRGERTGAFNALTATVRGLPAGRRVYWRARVRRAGATRVGPVRSFRVPPAAGSGRRVRLAIASCGTQFGPIFDHLARSEPDVFVWQGDLNYPDTHGPLAQTISGYAGIWREFLANPRIAPVLERCAFVAQRDDHDYGIQDSNATTIPDYPWAVAPWDALMGKGVGRRFSAGLADVWVLDQRRFKSDPALPDTAEKTLLGERQRRWLLAGLRRSKAPFKVVCSPCTLFMPMNARDGNWAVGFTAERDRILRHLDRRVSGQTIFVTGDTHLTAVHDRDGRFEARAAPVDIPVPNDVTLTDPLAAARLRGTPGVSYADERGHFALIEVRRVDGVPTLELSLVRQDGQVAYRRTFEGASRARERPESQPSRD
jgi:hypothetical protein